MKLAVWDTYVKRFDGRTMHFDILVPNDVLDDGVVIGYGLDYLKKKPFKTMGLSAKECRLCHIEQATEKMRIDIETRGFSIIEMENCN
ncbi:MAG: DUF2024 family protein [Bacteroidetes bacterium]|nr:DUF2024 family protein [Bacteroidota bacterium]